MGAETGGANPAMTPEMQKIFNVAVPVAVLVCSAKVSSVCF